MEQDRLPCTAPGPGQCGSDREVFERVWRRVMPEDRPDCPFTLYGDEFEMGMAAQTAQSRLQGPEEAEAVLEPPAAGTPAPMVPAVRPRLEMTPAPPACSAAAAPGEAVCLGEASAVHGELLQAMIADELTDYRTYQYMARRVGGGPARTLNGLAADERRHAKRLSAAYFLISGVQYWPDRLPPAPIATYLGGVRERFQAEQRGAASYRSAARETGDPCLQELFLELAGDEEEHARSLRGLLEQM